MLISGKTHLAGILGGTEQVKLSLSPAIHNAAFKDLEMDWVYLPFGTTPENLETAIRGLAAAGVRGMNVTMPHKVPAMGIMDRIAPSAQRVGALNTIEVRPGGELIGHNTDGDGLLRFLDWDLGVSLHECRALVIGTGGSARAAVASLGAAGVAHLCVLARDLGKAEDLRSVAGNVVFEAAELSESSAQWVSQASVVINATPVGQANEPPVIPVDALRPEAVLVDLVYRPPVTPLIAAARKRGVVAHSGLGMLLHQAALSFEIWTGVEAPLDAMSAAGLWELAKTADATH
ncbi:MAG TPA: shikimate dehydrogenase [Actinomycetota bacterium]|nr:shikimate dehydrogenase [Actinomycetota bacterium]